MQKQGISVIIRTSSAKGERGLPQPSAPSERNGMLLRKINAGLSLLTTVLLMDHAMFFSVWMLSRCSIEKSSESMPRILAVLMVVHAVLSVILLILGRRGGARKGARTYLRMNIPTVIQRASGALMLLLLALHVAGAANHFQPKMLHAVLHPLFFAAVLSHASVSVSKALVTLGVGNATAVRVVDAVMGILCGATFVAGVVGFYLCLFVGVAR